MTRIRWTAEAVDDLQAIRDFIAHDSPHYAAFTVEEILSAVERLERFPASGRVVPELGLGEVREVVKPPYRIVYRLRNEAVDVLTVFRSSRAFPPF